MAHSCLYAVQCVCRHDGCDHSTYGLVSAPDHFVLFGRVSQHVEDGGVSFRHQPAVRHHLQVPDSGFNDANGDDLHPARGVAREWQRLIIVERHPEDDADDDTRARDTAIAAGMAADVKLCPNYEHDYTVDDVIDEFLNDGWECWRDLMPYDHTNNRRHKVHMLFRPREEREQAAQQQAAERQRHRERLPVRAYLAVISGMAQVAAMA